MLTSARTQFVKNYAISSLLTTFMNHWSAKLKLSSTINYCDCLNGALYDFLIRTRAFPRYTLLFFSPLFFLFPWRNALIISRFRHPPREMHGYLTVTHARGVGNLNLPCLGWSI